LGLAISLSVSVITAGHFHPSYSISFFASKLNASATTSCSEALGFWAMSSSRLLFRSIPLASAGKKEETWLMISRFCSLRLRTASQASADTLLPDMLGQQGLHFFGAQSGLVDTVNKIGYGDPVGKQDQSFIAL
jgi:hypothetical protein